MNHCVNQPLSPPLAIRFSHRGQRETRVTRRTGEEAQWTMGRRKMRGEAASCPFSPSRLPLRALFFMDRETRERHLGTRQQLRYLPVDGLLVSRAVAWLIELTTLRVLVWML